MSQIPKISTVSGLCVCANVGFQYLKFKKMGGLHHSSAFVVIVLLTVIANSPFFTFALENINKQSETCGILTPIKNDVRTIVPWTIAIFDVSNRSQKNGQPRFLTSGFIISPTLVVSVLGGPSGVALQSLKNPPKFPQRTTHLLIGAGIKTTNFTKHDEHAQYARVAFIEPFRDFDPTNVYNHRVLYHLKTPLNLTTPYVHEVCLSLYLTRKGFAFTNTSSFGWDMVHSGFAKKGPVNNNDKNDGAADPWILTAWKARHGPIHLCQSHFRFYYQRDVLNLCVTRNLDGNSTTDVSYTKILDFVQKKEPMHLATATMTMVDDDDDDHRDDLDLCQSHGSVVSHAFGKNWFTASTVTLIPAKRQGRCNEKSVYTMAPLNFLILVKFLEWLYYAYKCPHNTFSCGADSKCIPLSKLCDDHFDCTDRGDEHYSLCGVEKMAAMEDPSIDFRLGGGFSANDDISQRCPPLPLATMARGIIKSCSDMLAANDQKVDCVSANFYGARIKIECDDYHSPPRFAFQSLDLQCSADGTWTGLRPFHCERDCGRIMEVEKNSGHFEFPWAATILKENKEICGATLIDQSFLLTAAGCVSDWLKMKVEDRASFELALFPFSPLTNDDDFGHNSTKNGQRFQIKNAWLSSFNKNIYSGLGLVQLETAVEINGRNKPMAACYLQRPLGVPRVGQYGHFISLEKRTKNSSSNKLVTWSAQVVATELCIINENGRKNDEILCTKALGRQDKSPLMGSGLFIPMMGPGPGKKTVHVLKGVCAESKMENDIFPFENVDAHADWILDTLEDHS